MDNEPSEVVFAATSLPTDSALVFRYGDGPVKVPAPRKRGRPVGSIKKKATSIRPNGQKGPESHKYEFINLGSKSTVIDHAARKCIKRRAMFNHTRRTTKHKEPTAKDNIGTIYPTEAFFSELVLSQSSHADPFDTLPIRLEPYMHGYLSLYITTIWETLYSIERRSGCNPMVNYWLPLAYNDPALLHTLIGCAASFVTRTNWNRGYPVFIRHLNNAMVIINQRLADSTDSVSDETLVVVATIAMMKKIHGSHDQWAIHMRGLKRLVDSRGGLESLDDKPLIQSKIYRADLCGSIDATRGPYFSACYQGFYATETRTYYLDRGFQELDHLLKLDPLIKEAMITLQNVINTISTMNKKSPQAEAARARFWLTSAQYMLLSAEHKNKTDARLQALEACRLVLLLFTVTAFNEFPPGVSTSGMLVAQLRKLLDEDAVCHLLTPEFRLWALFLTATSVTDDVHKSWCLACIAETFSIMRIYREEDFAEIVSMFPHGPSAHATICRLLYDEVRS